MTTIDVSAFLGEYAFRWIVESDPDRLVSEMDRVGIDVAWTSYLPALLLRDPHSSWTKLLALVRDHPNRLLPVPTVHPGMPGWEDDIERAREDGCPALRVYPNYLGLSAAGSEMLELVSLAGESDLPVILTVRVEDARQRHPLDRAPDLSAADLRSLARSSERARLIVTGASRSTVEEVHFGLTRAESERVLWDFSWIWGPPESDLDSVLQSVGLERFVLASSFPLRIVDLAFSKLDLLHLEDDDRQRILGDNLSEWLTT